MSRSSRLGIHHPDLDGPERGLQPHVPPQEARIGYRPRGDQLVDRVDISRRSQRRIAAGPCAERPERSRCEPTQSRYRGPARTESWPTARAELGCCAANRSAAGSRPRDPAHRRARAGPSSARAGQARAASRRPPRVSPGMCAARAFQRAVRAHGRLTGPATSRPARAASAPPRRRACTADQARRSSAPTGAAPARPIAEPADLVAIRAPVPPSLHRHRAPSRPFRGSAAVRHCPASARSTIRSTSAAAVSSSASAATKTR